MLLYSRQLFHIFLWKFIHMFFILLWLPTSQEKFHSIYPSTGGIMLYFWEFLGIFRKVLRNLKHFFDVLHECLDIIVVVNKLKNILNLPLLWTFLDVCGPLCIICIMYYILQIVMNHLSFSYLFLFIGKSIFTS